MYEEYQVTHIKAVALKRDEIVVLDVLDMLD